MTYFQKEITAHQAVLTQMATLEKKFEIISKVIINSMQKGGKIILMGNGGSAADAQHIAAELVGRYKKDRKGLAAIALTTDTSAITSIANDYGFESVFSRQLEGIYRAEDVVIGISTSGNSKNVLKAILLAKELGLPTIGFLGKDGGKLKEVCDYSFVIPSDDTPRIQEMHILLGHALCGVIENELTN